MNNAQIGFAPTTVLLKLFPQVPDELIPATLNVHVESTFLARVRSFPVRRPCTSTASGRVGRWNCTIGL
jgi:hypothetical protein